MTDFARLVASEEIRQLKHRYLRYFDAQEWAQLETCFAAGAQVVLEDRSATDSDTFVAELRARPTALRTVHQGHPPLLEFADDSTARATWYVEVLSNRGLDGSETEFRARVRQQDTYVRTVDGWKIQSIDAVSEQLAPTSPEFSSVWRELPETSWITEPIGVTPDQLADREAIRQVKSRYCRYLDTKDWKGWRSLFSDTQFRVSISIMDDDLDADGLVEAVAANHTTSVAAHQVHMPDIVFDGPDSARVLWALNDLVRRPEGHELPSHLGYANYLERYVREERGWCITDMSLRYVRQQLVEPLTAGMRPPQAVVGADVGSVPTGADLQAAEIIGQIGIRSSAPTQFLHAPEVRMLGSDSARAVWATHDLGDVQPPDIYRRHTVDYQRMGDTWRTVGSSA